MDIARFKGITKATIYSPLRCGSMRAGGLS